MIYAQASFNCLENSKIEIEPTQNRSKKWQIGFDWGKRAVISKIKNNIENRNENRLLEILKKPFDARTEYDLKN